MINLTVINIKDMVKYFVIASIVIIVLITIVGYIKNIKNEVVEDTKQINKTSFVSSLDMTIPSMEVVNHKDEIEIQKENAKTKKQNNKVKDVLGTEIKVIELVDEMEHVAQDDSEAKTDNQNATVKQIEGEKNAEEQDIQKAETQVETKLDESEQSNQFTNEYNGVKINNKSNYGLTKEMVTPDVTVSKENIIIYHTHTCESYTQSEKYSYEPTGNFRTTDMNFSIARVGNELTSQLRSYGYNVIHDMTLHDYPAYTGSYSRSLVTIKQLLKQASNTDVVIDMHRDAIGDNTYAPKVQIGDEYVARLMFVIGTDGANADHVNWNENLKFAIKIQEKANEMYPGLFKPIILRNSEYNQHVAKGACIIEVGSTGNTMDESLASMKYLAKVIDEVVK